MHRGAGIPTTTITAGNGYCFGWSWRGDWMLASRTRPQPAEYVIEHKPVAAASQANP
jgi:hypothetical protein